MTDPSSFRDSTQIVLSEEVVSEVRGELESEFTVSLFDDGEQVRVVGSPVEIKSVNDFLVRNGVAVP